MKTTKSSAQRLLLNLSLHCRHHHHSIRIFLNLTFLALIIIFAPHRRVVVVMVVVVMVGWECLYSVWVILLLVVPRVVPLGVLLRCVPLWLYAVPLVLGGILLI